MPAGVSAWTPLANITLGSSQASVTFSNISQAYRDLVVVVVAKGTSAFYVRFNGDTTSNAYFDVSMEGTGVGTASNTAANNGFFVPANSATNNPFNGSTIANWTGNVMDYSTTDKHKTMLSRFNRVDGSVIASAERWANSSALTSIVLIGNNWTSGDTFALYGVSA